MIKSILVRLFFVLLCTEPYLLTLAKTDYPSIVVEKLVVVKVVV